MLQTRHWSDKRQLTSRRNGTVNVSPLRQLERNIKHGCFFIIRLQVIASLKVHLSSPSLLQSKKVERVPSKMFAMPHYSCKLNCSSYDCYLVCSSSFSYFSKTFLQMITCCKKQPYSHCNNLKYLRSKILKLQFS